MESKPVPAVDVTADVTGRRRRPGPCILEPRLVKVRARTFQDQPDPDAPIPTEKPGIQLEGFLYARRPRFLDSNASLAQGPGGGKIPVAQS